MICPHCGHDGDRVVDSRAAQGGRAVRRRRQCDDCNKRFTTYEYVQAEPLIVVKRSGTREPFDRGKLLRSLMLACKKRPISEEQVNALVDQIEAAVQERYGSEIPSTAIGDAALRELLELDRVAYVRFASVYRNFTDRAEFFAELNKLAHSEGRRAAKKSGATLFPTLEDAAAASARKPIPPTSAPRD